MSRQYRIKNWSKFQHYKDRNPPWIKLHVEILASEDWVMLDDASKLLMVVCMIVAAKNLGVVSDDPAYFRRVAYLNRAPNLKPLIECGFLEPLADASKVEQTQADARPEKEGEQSRAEQKEIVDLAFQTFWLSCPKKTGKGAAEKAWAKAIQLASPEKLTAAMQRYAETQHGKDPAYTKTPGPWLNEKRWLDETSVPQLVKFEPATETGWATRLRIWRDRSSWLPQWGPDPSKPDCKCPPEILKKDAA